MSRLGIKYDGCKTTVDDLKKVSNSNYNDLIDDLKSILRTLEGLTYKTNTSGISNSISKAEEHKQKIMNFANGLDSYAEKLYNFDHSFYNNFVKLDGTNLKNYKSNIGDIDISDDEIENLMIDDSEGLEYLLHKMIKAIKDDLNLGDDSLIIQIRDKIKEFFLSDENPKALKFLLRGYSFKGIKDGKDVYIKLKTRGIDPSDLEKCAKYMHDELHILSDRQLANVLSGQDTRNIRKLENFIERAFSEDGAKIYDASRKKWSSYANILSKGEFSDLNKYIKQSDLGLFDKMMKNAKEAAVDDVLGEGKYIKENIGKAVDSFKSGNALDDIAKSKLSSKLEFVGKAAGVVDKVSTVWSNANDDLKDENGNWDFSDVKKDKKFAVDTAVDLGTSAGAAAAGAAIGSVVPGPGTVVGAVAGAAINVAINHKFGDPPKSAVDHVKDGVNAAVDKIGDCIGKLFW